MRQDAQPHHTPNPTTLVTPNTRQQVLPAEHATLRRDEVTKKGIFAGTKLNLTVMRAEGQLFGLTLMGAPSGIIIVEMQPGCADKALKAGDNLQR